DTSALLKLVHAEPESMPLRTWLARHPADLLSSALIRAEASRALMRNDPAALPQLTRVLAVIAQIPVSEVILDRAATLPDPGLRTLDAIHLASAELTPGIKTMLVYDKRMAEAARKMRITVASPA
ncbi:MAG: type II toxin-antitoxin system VapC family toxin, partial [Streptosporangiaceae bacterium]